MKPVNYEEILEFELPLLDIAVPAGFPSPAAEFSCERIDLNSFIKHPVSTYFMQVDGVSMIDANIQHGDWIVIDTSLSPTNNSIVVATIDGEFVLKRVKIIDNKLYLVAENHGYPPIEITEHVDFYVWGVAVYVLHSL